MQNNNNDNGFYFLGSADINENETAKYTEH